MRRLAAVVALLFAPALASAQAYGPNLVANGGFEAGALAPWAFVAGSGSLGDVNRNAHSGSYGFDFITDAGDLEHSIAQTIPTVTGTRYAIDFFATSRPYEFGPAMFNVYAGGALIGSIALTGATTPWTEYTLYATATNTSTPIEFQLLAPPCTAGIQVCPEYGQFLSLDDVSVRAYTTPEPATLALTFGGLAVVGAGAWRRRRA